jgi:ABC-type phosphate transport system permease subunit
MSSPSPYEPPSATPGAPSASAPPPLAPNETDLEHLRWLSIAHYVLSAVIAVFGCCGFIYVGMGAAFIMAPEAIDEPAGAESTLMGGFMAMLGVCFMAFAWGLAVALYLSGRWLTAHRHWLFCVIVACVSMLCQPLGTILGIFTLIVLLRSSVKVLFQRTASGAGEGAFGSPGDPGRSPFAT